MEQILTVTIFMADQTTLKIDINKRHNCQTTIHKAKNLQEIYLFSKIVHSGCYQHNQYITALESNIPTKRLKLNETH